MPAHTLPNFRIQSSNGISSEFLKAGLLTFGDATNFIAGVSYGRNGNKDDLSTVFTDNCGTCSTKHALLKKLADENGHAEIKLVLGLFRMHAGNTPKVAGTLQQYGLDFIPEAHNYLKVGDSIFDFTRPDSKPADFEDDLIVEIEMLPDQISGYKVAVHQDYLRRWLGENPHIPYDAEQLWQIREQCIADLSAK